MGAIYHTVIHHRWSNYANDSLPYVISPQPRVMTLPVYGVVPQKTIHDCEVVDTEWGWMMKKPSPGAILQYSENKEEIRGVYDDLLLEYLGERDLHYARKQESKIRMVSLLEPLLDLLERFPKYPGFSRYTWDHSRNSYNQHVDFWERLVIYLTWEEMDDFPEVQKYDNVDFLLWPSEHVFDVSAYIEYQKHEVDNLMRKYEKLLGEMTARGGTWQPSQSQLERQSQNTAHQLRDYASLCTRDSAPLRMRIMQDPFGRGSISL